MRRRQALLRALGVLLLLLLLPVVWGLTPAGSWLLHGVEYARSAGTLGALVFVLLFGVTAVLAVPASWAQGAAGFIYGPIAGFGMAWFCSVVFAAVNFGLARTVLRRRVEDRVADAAPWVGVLGERLSERGTGLVVLLRLSPFSPYHVVSYALGVTRVAPLSYGLGTALGCLPPVLLYSWMGASVTELAALLDGRLAAEHGAVMAAFGGLTLVVSGVLTVVVRRELVRVMAEASGTLSA